MTREQINEFTLRTSQANHSGLILILFDMEKIYMTDALEAYSAGDEENYLRQLELARRVHNELMGCLNPKDAVAADVLRVFRFIYARMNSSVIRKKPDSLDRCQAMMDTLRGGFVHLHELDTEDAVMKNTHKVYAGLTYGKGVLTESVQGVDYSSRGYKI